jgi:hypothetical protein
MRVTYRAPDPESDRVRETVQALIGGAGSAAAR